MNKNIEAVVELLSGKEGNITFSKGKLISTLQGYIYGKENRIYGRKKLTQLIDDYEVKNGYITNLVVPSEQNQQ